MVAAEVSDKVGFEKESEVDQIPGIGADFSKKKLAGALRRTGSRQNIENPARLFLAITTSSEMYMIGSLVRPTLDFERVS